MLVHSPEGNSTTLATGVNLIDIEGSFKEGTQDDCDNGGDGGGEGKDEEQAGSETDSDESMNRLLHGRNANNPYR